MKKAKITCISFRSKKQHKEATKASEKRDRTLSGQIQHFFEHIDRLDPLPPDA